MVWSRRTATAIAEVMLASVFLSPPSAMAQSLSPTPSDPPLPSAPSEDNAREGSKATHEAPDLFDMAAEHGVYATVFLNEELAGNPSGGIRQGVAASQYVIFGPEFDFQRLVGWNGASLHALVIAENSTGLSQKYIGGGVDVQENFAPFNFCRFFDLTLAQSIALWDEASLELMAGRTAAVPAFGESQYAGLFMNHAFSGPLYGFTQSSGTAVAPLASWGGAAKLNLTPKVYLKFGGYAVDAETLQAGTQIFDFDTSGVTGVNYLWNVKRVVPFLKVDKGLAEEKNGVHLMKPMPQLGGLLSRAKAKRIFGTKMRSVINQADPVGIQEIVNQQFEVAAQILAAGLVPIVEPEVDIHCPEKAKAEGLVKAAMLQKLNELPPGQFVFLKLTLPEQDDLYVDCVRHPNVARVLALSGGYSREEADNGLRKNHGLVASFSRALVEGLSARQTDAEFNALLDAAIQSIFEASTVKQEPPGQT